MAGQRDKLLKEKCKVHIMVVIGQSRMMNSLTNGNTFIHIKTKD
jgi:hypothetical protein